MQKATVRGCVVVKLRRVLAGRFGEMAELVQEHVSIRSTHDALHMAGEEKRRGGEPGRLRWGYL